MKSTLRHIRLVALVLSALGSGRLLEAKHLSGFTAPASVKGGSPIVVQISISPLISPPVAVVTFHADRPDVVPVLDFTREYEKSGSYTVEFPTRPVATPTEVTLSGTQGRTITAKVMVLPPVPTSVTLSPARAAGGSLVTATVTLDGPAPFSGFPIRIECLPAGLAMAPESVAVPPEETRVEFQIFLTPTAVEQSVTVRAISVDTINSTRLVIAPPALKALSIAAPEVFGGAVTDGYVELDAEAPPGGTAVSLRSAMPQAASVDPEVQVPAGMRAASFPIATSPQETARSFNLSASLGSSELTSRLTVLTPALAEVSLSPRGVVGGRPARGRVRLASPAAVDTTVALATLDVELALVPDQVVVPEGQMTVRFEVTTGRVFSDTEALITAAYSGRSLDAGMTLVPARRGDWEGDGDVDLLDFAEFQVCFTGPSGEEGYRAPSKRCAGTFDFDADADVDHRDFEEMIDLMIGPADGLPVPALELDETLAPEVTEVPGIDGGPPRPVAVLVDAAGNAMDFVEEELVILGSETQVDPFLARWRGNVLDSYDPAAYGFPGPKRRLVKIDSQRADLSTLTDDLRALNPDRTGELRISSEAGVLLLAVAARERREGLNVVLNGVPRLQTIADGKTTDGKYEDPATKTPTDVDAFQEEYFRADGLLRTGVTGAWKLLEQAGRLSNRIPIAIIDRGFNLSADFPVTTTLVNGTGINTLNPLKPWHATKVTSVLAGTLDNGYGAAGVAGPVAGQLIAFKDNTGFDMGRGIMESVNRGARIINISMCGDVPALSSLFSDTYESETREARRRGVLTFVGAGNQNTDVDAEDCCFGPFCWECAWHRPCENEGVICVGAMTDSATFLASYPDMSFRARYPEWSSNWGSKGSVPLWAPNLIKVGPTPDNMQVQLAAGTSMASPFAAGVAALIWAADPSFTADQVQDFIFRTAYTGDFYALNTVNAEGAVLAALGGDRPPSIEIIEPRSGESYPQTFGHSTRVVFHAAVNDPEGLTTVVTWRSDRQGILGFGETLARDDLLPGQHLITVSVIDSARFIATDQVTIRVYEPRPEYRIYEPIHWKEFIQGQQIFINGETFDPRTGGRLPDDQAKWYQSGTGVLLASGHKGIIDTANLEPGLLVLEFPKRDDGLTPGQPASVTVKILPPVPNTPPSAVIDVPVQNFTTTAPECTTKDVVLQGRGDDAEDGTNVELTWITNRNDLQDPVLGHGTQITAKLATPCNIGTVTHIISLRVTDRNGNTSYSQSFRTIVIYGPPK